MQLYQEKKQIGSFQQKKTLIEWTFFFTNSFENIFTSCEMFDFAQSPQRDRKRICQDFLFENSLILFSHLNGGVTVPRLTFSRLFSKIKKSEREKTKQKEGE